MNNKSRKIFGLIVFVILAIIFWFFFLKKDNYEITNIKSQGSTIVAFGDSLVQGVGASEGKDFVSILSTMVGEPIINLGISGNTTIDGLNRIDTALERDPKIVILLLGGNDYLKKIPMEETFDNLQKIVDKVHAKGSMVLLLGVRGGLFKDILKDKFDEFAKKNKVAFVPNVLDGIIGEKELLFDSIHPNDAGYKKIVDKVEPVLRNLLFK